MLIWITLFGRLADLATEIGREKPEHANAPNDSYDI